MQVTGLCCQGLLANERQCFQYRQTLDVDVLQAHAGLSAPQADMQLTHPPLLITPGAHCMCAVALPPAPHHLPGSHCFVFSANRHCLARLLNLIFSASVAVMADAHALEEPWKLWSVLLPSVVTDPGS